MKVYAEQPAPACHIALTWEEATELCDILCNEALARVANQTLDNLFAGLQDVLS